MRSGARAIAIGLIAFAIHSTLAMIAALKRVLGVVMAMERVLIGVVIVMRIGPELIARLGAVKTIAISAGFVRVTSRARVRGLGRGRVAIRWGPLRLLG